MMTPKFICFDENGLDEFFIFKHRYEKEVLNVEEHIPYTKFMTQLLSNIKDKSYYSAKTKNCVGFTDITIGDDWYVIYTPSDDTTNKEFMDAYGEIEYDFSKLKEIDMHNLPEDMESISFFTINGKMLPVS